MGDRRDDAEVMRDQDHGGVELGAQIVEQGEDLGLDRHVERRRRLVRDHDVRVAGESQRDHDPLAHAAGQLVRIRVDPLRGVRNAHLLQQIDRAPPGLFLRDRFVRDDRLDDLDADPVHGIQRRHRVLEDHRDLVPADIAQARLRHGQQVLPLVDDLALERRVLAAGQPEERHSRHALPGAGLADDAEHLAALELEVDAVDRSDDPVFGRESDLEALDLQQRFGHQDGRIRGSSQT